MSRQSTTGKLAAVTVRQSKPKAKPYKLSDSGGMYSLVNLNGSRYWRWKYRYMGKEKVLALGVHPNVSMTDARDKVLDAKKMLDQGIDPGIQKKQIKASNKHDTFEPIAEEWHKKGVWPLEQRPFRSGLANPQGRYITSPWKHVDQGHQNQRCVICCKEDSG